MVRMGRGETMSPGVLPWHMDAVAERYAQQDGQTLQAAGHFAAPICLVFAANAAVAAIVMFGAVTAAAAAAAVVTPLLPGAVAAVAAVAASAQTF